MKLVFSVEDTGMGIREEDLDKLFGSFQQVDTKKNYKKEGTGLGLAISKNLVELINGEIKVVKSIKIIMQTIGDEVYYHVKYNNPVETGL